MFRAIQAMAFGIRAVGRAPAIVLVTYVMLCAAVLPAAGVLARGLELAFDRRTLERVMPGEADTAWFERASRETAVGGSTFSPAIIGFAVQLSNIADVVEARPREALAIASLAGWSLAWTLLLGGILRRFASGAALSPRAFADASLRYFPRFAVIAVGTLLVYAVAALLYRAAPMNTRPLLLPVLAVLVGTATVIASYARARIAIDGSRLSFALASIVRLVRHAPVTVATHAAIALTGWTILIGGLAVIDLAYGAGSGPWRPFLVAQVYAVGRIVMRLAWEASSVALVRNAPGLT